MVKRAVSLFMTGLLSAYAFLPAAAAQSDIDSHWAKDSFLRLEQMNIINGYDDGTYKPDEKITRAEFFKIVNSAANTSKNSGSAFSDVPDGEWYKNTVDTAYTAKYASGYDDGTFRPDDFITRAEAAAAICKAFGGDIEAESDFADSERIPSWAKDYIDMLSSAGILSGYDDNTFRADEYITRGETAALFDKFIGRLYTDFQNLSDSSFDETVIIGVSDVIFKNVAFENDIYIGAGVSGGEVRFVDCAVNGNIYAAARNGAGIVLENTNAKKLCVNSTDSQNIVLTGSTVADSAVVRSSCSFLEMNTDKGAENVTVYAKAELSGDFPEVTVGGGRGITLTSGKIDRLNVTAAGSPVIDTKSEIGELNAKSTCIVNGKRINAGSSESGIGDNRDGNISYSYTLSRLNSGDFESDPLIGGARTDVRAESDCVLSDLKLSTGTLRPAFSPDITEYNVYLPNDAGSVSIIPDSKDSIEIKVRGETVEDGGYTASSFSGTSEAVVFDLYSELIKKNTYTVNVTGYGRDNVLLSDVQVDVPAEITDNGGNSYNIKLTGDIDYSSGKIPVTITLTALNPNSKIIINGTEADSIELDLYSERRVFIDAEVISEDESQTGRYTVTVEREKISEIDDPDADAVERLTENPSGMSIEDLSKAKITGVIESKLPKYKSYLGYIAYHAEDMDIDGKQQIIQKAIDVVNEYDGKIIHIEVEDHYKADGWNPVKPFLDGGGSVLNMVATVYLELELPEGGYEMRVRSATAWWEDKTCIVELNGVEVYSQKSGNTFGDPATGLKSSNMAMGKQIITVSEGLNKLTTPSVSQLYCDYIELEMLF